MQSKIINKTIYKSECHTLISALIWGSVIGAIVLLCVRLYPVANKAVSALPFRFRQYFSSMDSVSTYFASEVGKLWLLLAIIYSSLLCLKVITKQIKGVSCEVVYTSTASRGEIIRTKALRVFVNVSLVNAIITGFAFMALGLWGQGANLVNVFVYALILWVICLTITYFIFGLALMLVTNMNAFASGVTIVLVYLFGILHVTSPILAYFTPFSVLGASMINVGISGIAFYGIPLVIWAVSAAVLCVMGFCKFKNADLC